MGRIRALWAGPPTTEGDLSCATLLKWLPCRRRLQDIMGMELWAYLPTSHAKEGSLSSGLPGSDLG